MKHVLVALALSVASMSASATCSTHTVNVNGKVTVCTTCCFNGNCNTTCY